MSRVYPRIRSLTIGACLAVAAVALALLGLELAAHLFVPAWPAYVLRPSIPSPAVLAGYQAYMPDVVFTLNSWSMRDRERQATKSAGSSYRTTFVGDSFLEGAFTRAPLAARIEGKLIERGIENVEAVNLGVSATGPAEYYYRIRDVGLQIASDAIVLVFYAGNDFMQTSFSATNATLPFAAELPNPSLLGNIAPRITWLSMNGAQSLTSIGQTKPVEGEFDMLARMIDLPAAERLSALVGHMKAHYFPQVAEPLIREVISRGNDEFWAAFAAKRFDREFLQGWILRSVIDWELGDWSTPRTLADAESVLDRQLVQNTLTWLAATHRLVQAAGKEFLVALAPVGAVDPEYVDFWRPWPRYYSFNLTSQVRHKALARALEESGIPSIDLGRHLDGVPGTYRKSDAHWTEKGHELVADRLMEAVRTISRQH